MDEIRKNQLAIINLANNHKFEGFIFDYSFDRVSIKLDDTNSDELKNLEELENLIVIVKTHLGIKQMVSSVIDKLDENNCITVENNPSETYTSKREYARVKSDINISASFKEKDYTFKMEDISGNGIAFNGENNDFNPGDTITIKINIEEQNSTIETRAKIVETKENFTTAKFEDLDEHDREKIVKFVFREMTRQ